MLIKKLISFGIIILTSASIFTVSVVIAYEIPSTISFGSLKRLPSGSEELLIASLFIGIIHALIFAILDWRRKSESLIHILLSTFLVFELIMIFGFINTYTATIHYNFHTISVQQILMFVQIFAFPFLRNSLILIVFSIIAGIFNKNLFIQIKNRDTMP